MIGLDTHVWQTISLAMMRRNGDELLFLFRKINPVSLPISFSVNWFGCLEEPTTVSRKKKLSAFWRPCSTARHLTLKTVQLWIKPSSDTSRGEQTFRTI